MRTLVQFLASFNGLRFRCCCELWCRLQTWLGSLVAVALAQAGGYSSDLTAFLGTSISHVCGPKKTKTKQKNKKPKLRSDNSIPGRNLFGAFQKDVKCVFLFIHLFFAILRTGGSFQVRDWPTSQPWPESLWWQCWILNPLYHMWILKMCLT